MTYLSHTLEVAHTGYDLKFYDQLAHWLNCHDWGGWAGLRGVAVGKYYSYRNTLHNKKGGFYYL